MVLTDSGSDFDLVRTRASLVRGSRPRLRLRLRSRPCPRTHQIHPRPRPRASLQTSASLTVASAGLTCGDVTVSQKIKARTYVDEV